MRRAIVGARAHRALGQVWQHVHALPLGTKVVSGGADGVDTVAELSARQRGLDVNVLPAAWERPDGSVDMAAWLARNSDVVAAVEAVDAFPWPGCRGTLDTMRKARAAGLPVLEVAPDLDHEALLVFSGRLSYGGRGRLDITRGGNQREPGPVEAFAPSKEILERVLAARKRATELREQAAAEEGRQVRIGESAEDVLGRGYRAASLRAQAEQIEADAWAWYAPAYRAEMWLGSGGRPSPRCAPEAAALWHEAKARGVRPRPEAWRRLEALGFVVLVCACHEAERCHRHLLRAALVARGAVDGGELARP